MADNHGNVNLGSGSTINATGYGGSASSIGANGIMARTYGMVTGNNVTINTKSYGAYGVYAVNNGIIKLSGLTTVHQEQSGNGSSFGLVSAGSSSGASTLTVENYNYIGTMDTGSVGWMQPIFVAGKPGNTITITGTANAYANGNQPDLLIAAYGSIIANRYYAVGIANGAEADGIDISYNGNININYMELNLKNVKTGGVSNGVLMDAGALVVNEGLNFDITGDFAYGIHGTNANANVVINNANFDVKGTTNGAAIFTNFTSGSGASQITINKGVLHSNLDGIQINGGASNITFNDVTMSNGSGIAFHTINNSLTSKLNVMANRSYFNGVATTGTTSVATVSLNDNSYWGVTGNSNLTGLDSNNSHVDMTKDSNAYSTLTMNNLSGTGGLFTLDIDGTTVNQNDHLYVTNDFNGTQALALNETSGRYVGTEAVGTVLASVKNNNGTFTAVDNEGTLYWERYDLATKDSTTSGYMTDWYLKAVQKLDGETTTTDAIKSAGALNYYNWRDDDKLLQRMGELRANGVNDNGIWVRIKGSKTGRSGEYNFTNRSTRFEIGYDTTVKHTEEATRYQGFSLSYAKGTSSYNTGSGANKQIGASFYQTDIRETGHYLDLIAKLSQVDNDFSVYNTRGHLVTGKTSSPGVSISAEYGRKKSIHNNWYIEPQAQLTIGYLGGDTYETNNGVRVDQDGIKSAVARIGFNIGKELGDKGIVYLKANLLHEFWGDYRVTMSDYMTSVSRSGDFNDTWFEYGIGAAFKLNANSHIYVDVERSAGGSYKKNWQWNIGGRWNF